MNKLKIFAGSSNQELAEKIAAGLNLKISSAIVGKFADGETRIELKESVRGLHIIIVQSTCGPCNDNIMELSLMADAAKLAGAKRITAIVPYFGYARQDRRPEKVRSPISSKVVAKLLENCGIDQVIILDIHSLQQAGFFNKATVVNISAQGEFVKDIKNQHRDIGSVIVSTDVGGINRARAVAKELGLELAVIDKRRGEVNHSEVMNVIGDVNGKRCILIDDIVDTAGSLCHGVEALKRNGATDIYAYICHPVLSKNAIDTLIECDEISELIVTDSIPLSSDIKRYSRIRVISMANYICEILWRIKTKRALG